MVSLLTVLLPSFQNYRAFSFLGLVATTFTAWYMMGTAVHEGQQPGVTHSGPLDPQQFFTGATNILFTFGGHAMAVYVLVANRHCYHSEHHHLMLIILASYQCCIGMKRASIRALKALLGCCQLSALKERQSSIFMQISC